MPRCAFLTLSDPTGYVMDDDLAHAPLAALGWQVELVPWNRPGVDWTDYGGVVIRSTWDYQHQPADFLSVLVDIERSGTPLHNGSELVRWNLHKTYLRELAGRGVPVVPTLWAERLRPGGLAALHRQLDSEESVIKPVLSATAQGAFRLDSEAVSSRAAEVEAYFAERALMIQPFVRSVLDEGEFSLFYFNGGYSHAVCKQPKPADFRVQEEHGGLITLVDAAGGLREAGDSIMQALGMAPLYARVDLVRADGERGYWLMELELIEPSLYLRMDPRVPGRFAAAIDRRLRA